MDKDNFEGVEYSLQNAGTALVVFHVPNKDIQLNDGDYDRLSKVSETVALSNDPAKALANTKQF